MKTRGNAKRAHGTWNLIWDDYRYGVAVHEIARRQGLARSTVQYYIRKGDPHPERTLSQFAGQRKGAEKTAEVCPQTLPPKPAEIVQIRKMS